MIEALTLPKGLLTLSFVVPVLNEAPTLRTFLSPTEAFIGSAHEVIFVDGGSTDETVALLAGRKMYSAPKGRALQMNLGAQHARGDVLVFLHADTSLPIDAERLIESALDRTKAEWGRFDVDIEGTHWLLKIVAWSMNFRSRITGVATGDQTIFVRREAFHAVGGFPPLPIMEDIALSKRLRAAFGSPACIETPVSTSGRRWERQGIFRTILLMWALRLAYFLGVPPARLARCYGYDPGPN